MTSQKHHIVSSQAKSSSTASSAMRPRSASDVATSNKSEPLSAESNPSVPLLFSPEKKAARRDFSRLKDRAAWFCASPKGGVRSKAMLAVCIDKEISYETDAGRQTLRRGGALMQCAGKQIVALQPEVFISDYVRCFSDGTEICRLRDPEMQQAVALSQSNTQIRTRIEMLRPQSFFQSLLQVFGRRSPGKQIKEWNLQLHAHIQDLTARHRLLSR